MQSLLRSITFSACFTLVLGACGRPANEPDQLPFDDRVETAGYGDDPVLDALWDQCAGGAGVACDELFVLAPFGSEYEDFGASCGGRVVGARFCSD